MPKRLHQSSFIPQPEADAARRRSCGEPLSQIFVDLRLSPLCQTQIALEQLNQGKAFQPLRVTACGACFLVQLDEYVEPEVIFSSKCGVRAGRCSGFDGMGSDFRRRYERARYGD